MDSLKAALWSALFLLACNLSATANEELATPTSVAKQLWQEVSKSKETPGKEKIQNLWQQYIDMETLCEKALYGHWSEWTPDRKEEFKNIFGSRLMEQIEELAPSPRRKTIRTANFKLVREEKGNALVRTQATEEGETFDVDIYLTQSGSGWKVFGLAVDGIDLIRNWRAQFEKILREEGYLKLVNKLKNEKDAKATKS